MKRLLLIEVEVGDVGPDECGECWLRLPDACRLPLFGRGNEGMLQALFSKKRSHHCERLEVAAMKLNGRA